MKDMTREEWVQFKNAMERERGEFNAFLHGIEIALNDQLDLDHPGAFKESIQREWAEYRAEEN